jgi:predicted metal-binding protein
MVDLAGKDYVVIVQCHIVKQRCSGYFCEKAFNERTGGFQRLPADRRPRMMFMTCGGCCGRALHRKLANLAKMIAKRESITKDRILVQLSSCITKDNYHGPPCPHLDYLKTLLNRLNIDFAEDTTISQKAEQRRAEGKYRA